MSKSKTAIVWFTNDLRVQDNPSLCRAAQAAEQLLCVYIVDPAWFKPNRYGLTSMGDARWRFLRQSLQDLSSSLESLGQKLWVMYEPPLEAIARLITICDASLLVRSQNAGYYENQQWQYLKQRYQLIQFEELASHTLFTEESLPFTLAELPSSFSQFRKAVEPLGEMIPLQKPEQLPPVPRQIHEPKPNLPAVRRLDMPIAFAGGEAPGQRHLAQYCDSSAPSHYKEVRNALDGWQNSTKLSPWLASGGLSPRQVLKAIADYERWHVVNESTYWIKFELLWREYFQWYAHRYGTKLYAAKGIGQKRTLKSFYPERFARWCQGNTPYPLVNACMKQLNATGYMSNRGRQIVASCFIHELDLDWRYGAAYFEQQLVDYDVASNWGNWQYIAGVGADPRGGRHFNLAKQAAQYDPDGEFTARWRGEAHDDCIDSVDAADWPITLD